MTLNKQSLRISRNTKARTTGTVSSNINMTAVGDGERATGKETS